MEKNTAEMPVVMREAKMWRLRVNAATRHVRSHFGSSHLAAAPNWIAKNNRLWRCPSVRWEGSVADHATGQRRIDYEIYKNRVRSFFHAALY
jgi:hypothetical protein